MNSNPPTCGVRGTLSDADAAKLMNLAFASAVWTWDDRELVCELPADHATKIHVQRLATQDFKEPVVWWASWLDIDSLRDEAAMFTGPLCDEVEPDSDMEPGVEPACLLLQGHATDDDQRHAFF